MSEKQFVDGLIVKPPHEKAPDFVKCKISIKRKDLGNWLRGRDEEWINLNVKESRGGKWYAEIDDWKPNKDHQKPGENVPAGEYDFDDDLPPF